MFLPRTTQVPDVNGDLQTRHYITLIFSRRNAVMIPMGGLIVNIDEAQLIGRISGDPETPDELLVHLLYGEYPTAKKCLEEMQRHGIETGGSYLAVVILLDDFTDAER